MLNLYECTLNDFYSCSNDCFLKVAEHMANILDADVDGGGGSKGRGKQFVFVATDDVATQKQAAK